MNLAMAEPLTEADVVGTWAGLRPLVTGGTVGEKTADLSRRHKVRHVGERGGHGHRRQAHDLPARWPTDTSNAVVKALGRRGKLPHQAAAACSARHGPAPPDDEHLARRYGTLAADILGSTTTPRARDAARPRAALPPAGGDLRGARGDGHHARRRALAPHPRPPARPRRHERRGRGRRAADRARARVGRGRIRAEVDGFRAALEHERTAAGLPHTALDPALGACRPAPGTRADLGTRADRSRRPAVTDSGAPTPPIEFGTPAGRRRRAARRHPGRPSTPACSRTLGATGAEVLVDAGATVGGEPRLVAARDDLGARRRRSPARAAAVVRPADAGQVAAVLAAVQRGAGPGHARPPAAAACAARACRSTAASCSTSPR